MVDTPPVITAPVTGATDGAMATVLQESPVVPVLVGAQGATGTNPVATGADNTIVTPVAKGDNPIAADTAVVTKGDLDVLNAKIDQLLANQNTARAAATQDAAPVTITATNTDLSPTTTNTMICMPGMEQAAVAAPSGASIPSPVLTSVVSAQPDAATIAALASGGAPLAI